MISLLVTILIVLAVCGLFALLFHSRRFRSHSRRLATGPASVAALWLLYAVFDGWRFHSLVR